ncbi:MAG: adenylate/guanylate cyclase domain-containing protein [Anaerolineae bacterium]|jgi:class 3 adenylate cyclase|nr:adenylate/guanylate cyclase domain-containing protein [Anaerolineae bacterium]
MTDINTARLDQAYGQLQAHLARDPQWDMPFYQYLTTHTNTDLQHINVPQLAQAWQTTQRALIVWMLYATRVGVLDLYWESHCPHCQNLNQITTRMGDLTPDTSCGICHAQFQTHADQNIEVRFSVSTAIFPERELLIERIPLPTLPADFDFSQPFPVVFKPSISAKDVMLIPEFKLIFGQEMLSQRESLNIQSLTFLFTDITGSTALYQQLGDVRAYNLVRDHFDVLFRAIDQNQGNVVKTIGDAVMAVFATPEQALKAALSVQKSIREFNAERTVENGRVLVKIGLHHGVTIAVNLNNTLDYFGNTVNMAARIQGQSRSEEVLFSEEIYRDQGVQAVLKDDPQLQVSHSLFDLHGIGERQLYSVMLGAKTKR